MKKQLQRLLPYTLFITFLSLLSSCDSVSNQFVSASGNPGEILLVMDEDWLKGEVGNEMKQMLRAEVPALPQVEQWMHVQSVARKDFGDFLRNTRNILIVDNNKDIYSHNSVKFHYDEWAKGQLIIIVQTPSKDSIASLVKDKGEVIRNLLLRHELYRYADAWQSSFSSKADQYCQEVFQHHINLPEDILSYKKGKNFLWLSNNAYTKRTDVVIYTLPYNDPKDLSLQRLIARRDSVLGKNIPGGTPDSKMITTPDMTQEQIIKFPDGKEMLELRGLWETNGSSIMAGPFVAHVFVNKKENKIYYLEAFVYQPNENKRELIRRMQATLFSFRPKDTNIFNADPIKRIWWFSK